VRSAEIVEPSLAERRAASIFGTAIAADNTEGQNDDQKLNERESVLVLLIVVNILLFWLKKGETSRYVSPFDVYGCD